MKKFEVIFYENGECPVEEFISALDIKMRAKMVGLLEILEENGNSHIASISVMEYLNFDVNKAIALQECCTFSIMREK